MQCSATVQYRATVQSSAVQCSATVQCRAIVQSSAVQCSDLVQCYSATVAQLDSALQCSADNVHNMQALEVYLVHGPVQYKMS